MKAGQLVMGMLLVGLLGSSAPVLANEEGKRGASASAYRHASDEAVFNRVSDWFATRGKSASEKDAILGRRRTARAAQRAQQVVKHEAKQAQRDVQHDAQRTRQAVKRQAKHAEQGLRSTTGQ